MTDYKTIGIGTSQSPLVGFECLRFPSQEYKVRGSFIASFYATKLLVEQHWRATIVFCEQVSSLQFHNFSLLI